jgi:predicted nucleic acid-binding protein
MADDPAARPIIALDTNALVQSIPTRGRFRPIIEGFDAGRFQLVVSNEILLEYEEVLKAIGGPTAWSAFESLLIARCLRQTSRSDVLLESDRARSRRRQVRRRGRGRRG